MSLFSASKLVSSHLYTRASTHPHGLSRLMRITGLLIASLTTSLITSPAAFSASSPVPAPPSLQATGYLLKDFNSGQILVDVNADERLEPASLTKLMTAYVVFKELKAGHIQMLDLVTISEKAWRTGGSKMFIEVGKQVPVEDLIRGMIVQSGNDASVALAEFVGGNEASFANLMNRQAELLGMKNSHFMNATGLPAEQHYVTARDLATLASAIIGEFPNYYSYYAEKVFTYNKIKQHNRNKLLWRDESVDGLKTGHTKAAGYCLAASAKRKDMRLISIVMGTRSKKARANESQALLNYGFRFFESHKLFSADETIATPKVWKGAQQQVALGLDENLYVTLPRGHRKDLVIEKVINTPIEAPLSQGQTLGYINVSIAGKSLLKRDLNTLDTVAQGGLWQRLIDTTRLWF